MRYAWLGGLALSALPMTASTSHADVRVNVGLPFIGIGFGHHHGFVRPFYGPVFRGAYFGPRVYVGPTYYYPPSVVYAAPPTVVYTTPAPVYVPQTYVVPAPQYYAPPAAAPVPVPQPAPQSAPAYYGQ